MRTNWVPSPCKSVERHNGQRSDCPILLSGRESFSSHYNIREEREGSEEQPETLGSRRGRWNEIHTECRLREKQVRETKGKICIFLCGKEIAFRKEDSVSWGIFRGDDLGEVREWVALRYTEGSGPENVEPKGQELRSTEVPLPANFSIHKLRALMKKWHRFLVLSGCCFVFFLCGILAY